MCVLSHVVDAMCATCGRVRAKSDAIGAGWQGQEEEYIEGGGDREWITTDMEKSSEGGPASVHSQPPQPLTFSAMQDCENFIKIGVIARVLQSLLGHLNLGISSEMDQNFLDALEPSLMDSSVNTSDSGWESEHWKNGCFALLKAALVSIPANFDDRKPTSVSTDDVLDKFASACSHAQTAASSFLSDAALILQMLIPGVVNEDRILDKKEGISALQQIAGWLRIEPLYVMMESSKMQSIVSKWYQQAMPLDFTCMGTKSDDRSDLVKRLDCKREFRSEDWPMIANTNPKVVHDESSSTTNSMLLPESKKIQNITTSPKSMSPSPLSSPTNTSALSSRKCVALLGGYRIYPNDRPRIKELPTSYTDLYAELGVLCPDTERTTALCLVCGEILNANGRSECTKHALRCGAGCGIFFLLQECIGLIMHGHKAAYVHSPYVDSHGETPQYRGRPLNLDLNRYEILKEMWVGHLVRERVITERGSSRQVIIPNFY